MRPSRSTTTAIKPIVWDYNRSSGDLSADHPEIFDQPWALSRLLQHHSFYEVIDTVPFATLQQHWPAIKPSLLSKSLQDAYEYYINKVVSVAR